MTTIADLQAPQNDREILVFPSWKSIPQLVEQNRQRRAAVSLTILDHSYHDLCRQARTTTVDMARRYFHERGEPFPILSSDSLVLAGHQPELFHPGVWLKNFALHRLARDCGAVPLNLVVDNDAVKSTAVKIPRVGLPLPLIEEASPSVVSVPFDEGNADMPFEERRVVDEELFRTMPERAGTEWNFTPLLKPFWNEVCQQAATTPLLGERLAAARRVYERRWDCHNWELPVSRLCDTEPYAFFALHLLSDLPRFHDLHNRIVQAYRRRHHLRSRNHPVPDLVKDGDWLEAPFWCWRAGSGYRERLFARQDKGQITLRAGNDMVLSLSADLPRKTDDALNCLRQFRGAGFKIRSRALTNTLFARVFLGDLFVHGIGGGKYDELTDELIHGFYGLVPPQYMVLSGTLQLPLPRYPSTEETYRELHKEWRDRYYNPQRHVPPGRNDAAIQEWIKEKQHWVEKRWSTRAERWRRFARLKELTHKLRAVVAEDIDGLHKRWHRCKKEQTANSLLGNRDYAFCLYPEELLQSFLRVAFSL